MQASIAYVVDMGTTGIAYAKSYGNEQENQIVVNSAALSANRGIDTKIATTLHIFQEVDKDIFDEETLLQRAYFGDVQPMENQNFISTHQGVEYTFHGLKTYVYRNIPEMSATNAVKMKFESDKIFLVALKLLRKAIERDEKDLIMPDFYKIVFLVPAVSDCTLYDKLRTLIIQVFHEITPNKVSEQIFFMKEPVAATLYASNQLQAAGIKLGQGMVEKPRVAILDLGGGTCDFNLTIVNLQEINTADMKTNNGCFVGGFNVDQCFMSFVQMMFPEATPKEKDKYLLEFMKKKVMQPFMSFVLDFPKDFVDIVDKEKFVNRIDNPFMDLYSEGQLEEMYDNREFEVSGKLQEFCFESVFALLNGKMKDFISMACQKRDIQNAIMVGGFAQSKFITEKLTESITKEYAKYHSNTLEINKISHQSLAVVKGGTLLYTVSRGDFGNLIKVIVNPVNTDVYFLSEKEEIQIIAKGSGLENADNIVPQLSNVIAKDSTAKEALAQFLCVSDIDGVETKEQKEFKIDISGKGPFEIRLNIHQGAELFVWDQTNKDPIRYTQVYGKSVAQGKDPSQPTLYFLFDTTLSMEPFVQALRVNMQKVLDVIDKYKFVTKLVYYTDYAFTDGLDDCDAKTKPTKDLQLLQQSMEAKEKEIIQQEGIRNDMTENLLPAFESVLKDKTMQNKVIVVISDCCAHTHIGCQCIQLPKIGSQDPIETRKAEVDRLYGCEKCRKKFVWYDWVLKDEVQIQDHKQKWEHACTQLLNVPIVFVPVLQEQKVKIKEVDEQNLYAFSGAQKLANQPLLNPPYSVLKTQRMMKLMGCENVKTVDASEISTFVQNLVKVVEEQITVLMMGNERK